MTRTAEERRYLLHGLTLAVSAPAASATSAGDWGGAALDAFHARLAALPAGNPSSAPDLRFELEDAADLRLERPAGARPVYDPPIGEIAYADAGDELFLEQGERLRVLCEPAAGRARYAVGAPSAEDLWVLSHPLLSVPLAEMLKRRGLHPVHAAGLARHGRALLLPGTRGAGKSTLTLALLRAGCGLLGDDTVLLARRPEGLRALAFPDEIDLTASTLAFFPEVEPWLEPPPAGWQKRQLRPERAWGAGIVWESEPAAVVFPRVSGRARSTLAPIDAGEALLELAPNVLLTEPRASQDHLDALAALASSCRCYRLETGSDLDEAAGLLCGLLEPR
jgi:hypothetical protein